MGSYQGANLPKLMKHRKDTPRPAPRGANHTTVGTTTCSMRDVDGKDPKSGLGEQHVNERVNTAMGIFEAILLNDFARTLEDEMDKDRVSGAAKQVAGSVKETAGKLVGDSKMQADGKAEKMVGKIQNAIGGAQDAVREAVDGKKR